MPRQSLVSAILRLDGSLHEDLPFSIPKKCRTTPDSINSWENLFCGEIDDRHCRSVCVQNVFFIRALLGFKDSNNVTLINTQYMKVIASVSTR
jgi:hypothetical protein